MTDVTTDQPPAVDEQLVRELTERARAEGLSLTGEGGLLRLAYLDGRGVVRQALTLCTDRDFVVGELSIEQRDEDHDCRTVSVWLTVQGSGSISDLTAALADIDGVLAVSSDDANTPRP